MLIFVIAVAAFIVALGIWRLGNMFQASMNEHITAMEADNFLKEQ